MTSRARPSDFDDGEAVAGFRRGLEAEHLDRHRRAGFLDALALVVDEGADAAPFGAGDDDVAEMKRAALDEHGGDGTAALVELGLDDGAFGGAIGIGAELEHLGLKEDGLEQLVEVGPLDRRDLDVEHVAAHRFDEHFVLEQFGAHALRIGVRLVDLVDGDDDRHLRRLGVIDRLDGLRHDAVVGGDDQDDDVGDLGAAGAHRREGGVAGRVDEGDLLAVLLDLVGADMLGDAAGLAGDDVGLADGVEKRRLAVVDVAHDGDDRRPRHLILVAIGLGEQTFLDVGFGDAADRVAHFLGDELGDVGVDDVVDLEELALLHQELDDVDAALGHAVGEFLDGDRLGNDDLAHDLLARAGFQRAGALALAAAAHGGERALAFGIVEGVDQRQLAAAAIVGALDRFRLGRNLGLDAAAQSAGPILVVLDFLHRLQGAGPLGNLGNRCRGLRLGIAKAAARRVLGALARRLLGLAAGVFFGLAALGLVALAGETLGLLGAAAGDLLGNAALFGLMHLGIGQGAGAGVEFIGGKLAKDHAGGRARAAACSADEAGRAGCCTGAAASTGWGRGAAGRRGFRLLAGQGDAALLALDLNGVGAAV